MHRQTQPVVEDLQRAVTEPHIDGLADIPVGHAVVQLVQFDVVVLVDGRMPPLSDRQRVRRQRPEHGLLDLLEKTAPTARALLERTLVQQSPLLQNRIPDLAQTLELAVAQGAMMR